MIRLPRLLDAAMQEVCRLQPLSLALEMNLAPLSTADMLLPAAPAVTVGQYAELFTLQGSAGVFRVQQTEATVAGATRVQLVHGIASLADAILPADVPQNLTARQGLAAVFAQQSLWQLGQVDLPESLMITWRCGHASLLEAFLTLLEELPGYYAAFDQSALPWTVHILALPDSPACECRLSRNLHSLSIETDRSELCTQLIVPGADAPLNADTQSVWGVVTRAYEADAGLTQEEINRRAERYLAEHKQPGLSVSLSALEMSQVTGEALDRFTLGYPCRVCLPEQDLFLQQRIVSLAWDDLFAAPARVRLTLASHAATAADLLASVVVDATRVRRQTLLNAQELDTQKELILRAQESIELLAEEIALKADAITLQGYVTIDGAAEMLENASIQGSLYIEDTLNAYTLIGTDASIANADIQAMTFADTAVSWKRQYVVTGIGSVSQSKRYLTLATPDGGSVSLDIVTNVDVTPNGAYIWYLGGAQ